jgi:hypothetical protein
MHSGRASEKYSTKEKAAWRSNGGFADVPEGHVALRQQTAVVRRGVAREGRVQHRSFVTSDQESSN